MTAVALASCLAVAFLAGALWGTPSWKAIGIGPAVFAAAVILAIWLGLLGEGPIRLLVFVDSDTVMDLMTGENTVALLLIQLLLLLGVLGTFLNKTLELQASFLDLGVSDRSRLLFQNWLAYRLGVLIVMAWVTGAAYWTGDSGMDPIKPLMWTVSAACGLIWLLVAMGTYRAWAHWSVLPRETPSPGMAQLVAAGTRIWMGMDVKALYRARKECGGRADASRILPLGLTGLWAMANSAVGPIDKGRFHRCKAKVAGRFGGEKELEAWAHRPVVVLGHWGSGTTLLHEQLDLHPDLTAPTCFECWAPHASMILSEGFAQRWLPMAVSPERPMDGVALSFFSPQEDEFAYLLEGLRSVYLRFMYPRTCHNLPLAQSLQLSESELKAWVAAMRAFVERVLVRRAMGQPSPHYRDRLERVGTLPRVVLKSPAHTARPDVVRKAFDGAQFVLVQRDPEAILRSTVRTWRLVGDDQGFQTPLPGFVVDANLLRTFELVLDEVEAHWLSDELRGGLHVVRYDDIDPSQGMGSAVATLNQLVQELGLQPFGDELAAFLARKAEYRKNAPMDLRFEDESEGRRVCERYRRVFEAYRQG